MGNLLANPYGRSCPPLAHLSRAQLLVRLALEGHRAAQWAGDERRRRRLEAVRKQSGIRTGAYGTDYLQHLREEWPA